MAIGAVDAHFVDTNILVYAQLSLSPWHGTAVAKLQDLENSGSQLWISRQVLREYFAAMTAPGVLTGTIPVPVLLKDIRDFSSRFHIAEDGPGVTSNLLNLLTTILVGGRQVHDANLVATMLEYNIPNLLTHNTKDFARFASLITVVPLVP